MNKITQSIFVKLDWLFTGQRAKVLMQTGALLFILYIAFNVGRVMERDDYERVLDKDYPLRPQVYFGGITIKHLQLTW
jgi:hypothetical protein